MENTMYSNATDEKWQQKWKETQLYRLDDTITDRKLYLLEMFSYPSGKNLHIGHWWNYSLSDSYGRLKRMQGYQVFHPPGFDAFGLPAENYAIKSGVHPDDSTRENIATMERQFRTMGTTYDWEHEIVTCNPEYYRWTQWLFLKLFERDLAYRKEAPVNWCPSCMTVLANEQVANGKCERCDTSVVHQNMTQWFFRITSYAEELLSSLSRLDWPEKTKRIQENWIGKSHGCEIDFLAAGDPVTVFTTRADTLMGVTYLVLAPEHPLVEKLTVPGKRAAVREYQNQVGWLSDIERLSMAKEKTGVFTGSYANHPVTGKLIPIWIADYVLTSYGTGAVMAVPAHDERDYVFAQKHGIPVIPVVQNPQSMNRILPTTEDGVLYNSGDYNGMSSEEARAQMSDDLEEKGLGRSAVQYRLRDWLVSRQRYWGTPIPIVHCDACGTVPVPESELPVLLPYEVAFRPNGQSPLAACAAYVNTLCPKCGKPAKRDTDTLDTFVCSSWYYLRFLDNKNRTEAFSTDRINRLMPVDKYVGGIEHAAMHLLYARFITKALRDMGYLQIDEPFASLVHQGIILDADGKKMSKRSGAISPDHIVEEYGVDVFRMHLGFGFSYLDGGPWNGDGIKAVDRFVGRICRAVDSYLEYKACMTMPNTSSKNDELEYIRQSAIRQVTEDIDHFQFNTAIARIMEFVNALIRYQAEAGRSAAYEELLIKDLVLLLAPLAPHLAEELWMKLGYDYSVHNQKWPVFDASKLVRKVLKVAVQVNGTLRGIIEVTLPISDDELKKLALADKKVKTAVGERVIRKAVIVPNRLINFVC